jgi:hypothetical protein
MHQMQKLCIQNVSWSMLLAKLNAITCAKHENYTILPVIFSLKIIVFTIVYQ